MDDFELIQLVGRIYSHSTELEGWDRILGLLARATGVSGAVLATHRYSDGKGFVRNAIGLEPWSLKQYEERFCYENPWLEEIEDFQPGQLLEGAETTHFGRPVKGDFYRKLLIPQGVDSLSGLVVDRDEAMCDVIALSSFRPSRRGQRRQIEVLQRLSEHLVEANRAYKLHEKLRDGRRALEAVLNCQRVATLLLGEEARALFANEAARRLFEQRDGLELKEENRLHAESLNTMRQIDAVLDGARKVGPDDTGTVFIKRPSGKRPFCLRVAPVTICSDAARGDQQLKAVTIIDPETIFFESGDLEPLRNLYGLTVTENKVITKLLSGSNILEIAGEMSISPHTARTHLKRIFSKTGTGRQGELISMVYRLLGPA